MALACSMLRAWWRRQSTGSESPRSMNAWRRLPSSWAGIRDVLPLGASLHSSPFITPYLFLSLLSHGLLSHWFAHTLMGVIFFAAALLVTFFCLFSYLPLCLFIFCSRDRLIHPGSVLMSVHKTSGCSSEARRHVAYVEHVVVRVTISHSRRGDLSITLASPSGTTSQLLANR